jgi:hypothetical protein
MTELQGAAVGEAAQPEGRRRSATRRPSFDPAGARHTRLGAVAALAVVLAAGCGLSGLTGGGGGGGGSGGGGGPVFRGDPCALLTNAEIQAVLGSPPDGSSSTKGGAGTDAHCEWTAEGDTTGPTLDFGWGMQLDVKSPGGKQDFLETRQFMGLLKNGLNSLVAPVESGAASFGINANIGISGQAIPGLGDDAYVGAAGAIYTIKGDTEVTLQLIAFSDPKAQEHAVALTKLVLNKLP